MEHYLQMEQRLEQMMTDKSLDVYSIIKEMDSSYNGKYSTQDRMHTVKTLIKLRRKYPEKNGKLQRLIDHYAVEYDNMLVLKP